MRREYGGWAACLPPYFPYIKCPPPRLLFNTFKPIGESREWLIAPHNWPECSQRQHNRINNRIQCSQRQHNRINNRIHAHSATNLLWRYELWRYEAAPHRAARRDGRGLVGRGTVPTLSLDNSRVEQHGEAVP
ncbi:hypothetical protein J6590_076471 [Homalodisca vitripennis]|nr:hypothetical protein J6590_076471 [Homalodisca vitripennis]